MRIIQPSKINLSLKITGLLPDGRHSLFSVFMPLYEPCDTITLDTYLEKGALEIRCDTPGVPQDMSNLAAKAALAYAAAAAIKPSWRITIQKNIPVAAGMGGGSSDAAGVLRLLNSKYGALAPNQLHRIAATLGSDVPYFLDPVFAFMDGAGDNLAEVLPDITVPMMLIMPGFPISAGWAYQNFDHSQMGDVDGNFRRDFAGACRSMDWKKLGSLLHNDLAPAAVRKFPMLALIMKTLEESGVSGFGMTGSGPVCFAFSPLQAPLDKAETAIKNLFPEIKIMRLQAATGRKGTEIYE